MIFSFDIWMEVIWKEWKSRESLQIYNPIFQFFWKENFKSKWVISLIFLSFSPFGLERWFLVGTRENFPSNFFPKISLRFQNKAK